MTVIREWDIKEYQKFDNRLFNKKALEIGCGNGLFLSEIARDNRDTLFFGLEIKAKCINKTEKKIERYGLENVILINGDVFTAIERFFEPSFFDTIYINFPDPWFKKRHLKKRVVSPEMVIKYHKYLADNSKLFFVTDNSEYREYGINAIIQSSLFEPFFPEPYYVNEFENYHRSLYEEKWRKENKSIFYSLFTKK